VSKQLKSINQFIKLPEMMNQVEA